MVLCGAATFAIGVVTGSGAIERFPLLFQMFDEPVIFGRLPRLNFQMSLAGTMSKKVARHPETTSVSPTLQAMTSLESLLRPMPKEGAALSLTRNPT